MHLVGPQTSLPGAPRLQQRQQSLSPIHKAALCLLTIKHVLQKLLHTFLPGNTKEKLEAIFKGVPNPQVRMQQPFPQTNIYALAPSPPLASNLTRPAQRIGGGPAWLLLPLLSGCSWVISLLKQDADIQHPPCEVGQAEKGG